MRTKEASKCTVTSGQSIKSKIMNNNIYHTHIAEILLVSVIRGSCVVEGIRDEQMMPSLLNKAF